MLCVVLVVVVASVGGSFVGICGDNDPNSMVFEFCTIDAHFKSTNLSIYRNVGGILSNEFTTHNGLANFVTINISTLINYVYTADTSSGALHGQRIELPAAHVLSSIEQDVKTGYRYGLAVEHQYMRFVRVEDSGISTLTTLGTGILQSPGLSTYDQTKGIFYAVCKTSQGATLFRIRSALAYVSSVTLKQVEVESTASLVWDEQAQKMYLVRAPQGSSEAFLEEIDIISGETKRTIYTFSAFPSPTGAVALDSSSGTFYAVHQDSSNSQTAFVAIDLNSTKATTTIVPYVPVSLRFQN
eukprot:m.44020 g.44020  ORF g.44020 m.44020 type:complete len:299 (+) comp17207_c1_seq2:148-1044(+)